MGYVVTGFACFYFGLFLGCCLRLGKKGGR